MMREAVGKQYHAVSENIEASSRGFQTVLHE